MPSCFFMAEAMKTKQANMLTICNQVIPTPCLPWQGSFFFGQKENGLCRLRSSPPARHRMLGMPFRHLAYNISESGVHSPVNNCTNKQ